MQKARLRRLGPFPLVLALPFFGCKGYTTAGQALDGAESTDGGGWFACVWAEFDAAWLAECSVSASYGLPAGARWALACTKDSRAPRGKLVCGQYEVVGTGRAGLKIHRHRRNRSIGRNSCTTLACNEQLICRIELFENEIRDRGCS